MRGILGWGGYDLPVVVPAPKRIGLTVLDSVRRQRVASASPTDAGGAPRAVCGPGPLSAEGGVLTA